jgi:excisionase family DNA binding protein
MKSKYEIEPFLKDILEPIIENSIRKNFEKYFTTHNEDRNQFEEYLDTKSAANFLQISICTLHRLKRSGKIKYCRVGKKLKFQKSELVTILKTI